MCHPVFLDNSPSSLAMPTDRNRPDRECRDPDSLPTRSRAGSRLSATATQFGNIQLVDSPRSLPLESRPSSSSPELLPSSAYLISLLPTSATHLPTPTSAKATFSAFPFPSPENLDAEWSETNVQQSEPTPLLRVETAPDYSRSPESSPQLSGASPTMRHVPRADVDRFC